MLKTFPNNKGATVITFSIKPIIVMSNSILKQNFLIKLINKEVLNVDEIAEFFNNDEVRTESVISEFERLGLLKPVRLLSKKTIAVRRTNTAFEFYKKGGFNNYTV